MSAQDQLKALLREELAPRLRELGLRGTERTFSIPDAKYFAQIGVQSSTSSTRESATFTLNVQVVEKAGWAAAREAHRWLPKKPSPNTIYAAPAGAWRSRIGTLVDGRDTWWTVDAEGDDGDGVVAELMDAIVEHALPAMRARMT